MSNAIDVIGVIERVAKLEEKVTGLNHDITDLKRVITKLDARIWFIITGVIANILLLIVNLVW
jgi:hypothetical protein